MRTTLRHVGCCGLGSMARYLTVCGGGVSGPLLRSLSLSISSAGVIICRRSVLGSKVRVQTTSRKFDFKGLMAPVFTPFNDDESLNLDIVPRYAQLLHDGGVTGVFVCGTLGEGLSLTSEERERVAGAWVECRAMVGAVVVQVGGSSLRDAQRLARHAAALGVSAIACFPPLFDRPATVDDLARYCAAVASAAPTTPLLYYHYPGKTGVTFPMDEFLEVAAPAVPTLAGLKFTSMDVAEEGAACLKAAGGSMTVLSGFDQTLSEARRLGFPGAINGGFNFMPLEAGRLFCLAGSPPEGAAKCRFTPDQRQKEVERLQEKFNAPWMVIGECCGDAVVSGAKLAMGLLTGLCLGPAREPLRRLGAKEEAAMTEGLRLAGFTVRENA